ncbi:MAG TPA: NAD(+) synthase [Longimicrobiales bacterium]|nr:NAD(+) synthase [Longimicrobiales bacterium]
MDRLRDASTLRASLVAWMREQQERTAMDGFVFGLSGGVDSAVVCGLAAEAVGAEHCLGLIMPIESAEEDARLAQEVAARFGVTAFRLDLDGPFGALLDSLADFRERAERLLGRPAQPPDWRAATGDVLARANLKPRLRMLSLYYYANLLRFLVVGTGNRDEFTVGYYTKWGDGAADLFPLGDLVKAEVWALARDLGVPADVVERAPTAGLWPGQTDEQELGFPYALLDRYLLEGSSGDDLVDAAIRRREETSRHKSAPPPVARPS